MPIPIPAAHEQQLDLLCPPSSSGISMAERDGPVPEEGADQARLEWIDGISDMPDGRPKML